MKPEPAPGPRKPTWTEAYFIGKHYARRAKLKTNLEYEEIAMELGINVQAARLQTLVALGRFVFGMHRLLEQSKREPKARLKPVTAWSVFVPGRGWQHNHLEDGHAPEPRPIPRTDKQFNAWKGATFRKELGYLDAGGKFVAAAGRG